MPARPGIYRPVLARRGYGVRPLNLAILCLRLAPTRAGNIDAGVVGFSDLHTFRAAAHLRPRAFTLPSPAQTELGKVHGLFGSFATWDSRVPPYLREHASM